MARFISSKRVKIHSVPGSLHQVHGDHQRPVRITHLAWDKDSSIEEELTGTDPAAWKLDRRQKHWIDIDGVHDQNLLEALGERFSLHPLTTEDLVNSFHSPKYEDSLGYGFIIIKMLRKEEEGILSEQINIIFTRDYVLTFQEEPGDVFDPVRERLRKGLGRVRSLGCDYLVFSLLDAIVDNYILIVEALGEDIEHNEDRVFEGGSALIMNYLRRAKNDMIELRRIMRPLRDMADQMVKTESGFISRSIHPFLIDLKDHVHSVYAAVDGYRDMLNDQLALHTALQGQRMNEVMKVLTVISTIFIPLTFLAGIYGMNFSHMPELDLRWGYPVLLGVMLVLALVMVGYFRARGWIGSSRHKRAGTRVSEKRASGKKAQ